MFRDARNDFALYTIDVPFGRTNILLALLAVPVNMHFFAAIVLFLVYCIVALNIFT